MVLEGLDVSPENAAGGAGVEVHLGTDVASDAGDPVERHLPQVVALAGQRDEQILLARLTVGAPPDLARRGRAGGRQGQWLGRD